MIHPLEATTYVTRSTCRKSCDGRACRCAPEEVRLTVLGFYDTRTTNIELTHAFDPFDNDVLREMSRREQDDAHDALAMVCDPDGAWSKEERLKLATGIAAVSA